MYVASYQQHIAACMALAKAQNSGKSVEDMANRLGVTEDTFRRKLHGEAQVRTDELAA